MTIRRHKIASILKLFKGLLFLAFLPVTLPIKTLRGKNKLITKILAIPFSLFILLPVWGIGGIVLLAILLVIPTTSGLFKVPVPIFGSSMEPTISDNTKFEMRTYRNAWFKPIISRGDIITFENANVDEGMKKNNKQPAAVIKRVIGIQGDIVEIKNGHVYLNDQILIEPYTAKPRSTFGHEAIKECQKITIPEGKVFALGDNRKRSADSRDYNLASLGDIEYVLPFSDQGYLKNKWRDTKNDATATESSFLDPQAYVDLLNKKRVEAGLKTLKLDTKLSRSASFRAEAILKYNDSSYEATISGYPRSRSMADAGYYNIISGEHNIFGYYDAQELYDYIFQNPKNDEFYLNKDYQDIGVATVVGNFNGCPVQIVVQHLAGYVPPNYKQSDIDSWKKSLDGLRNVQPGWESLKKNDSFYQGHKSDVDRITSIISQRMGNISAIVSRMEANQWLTAQERNFIEIDKTLYDEQETLATKLNRR